MTNYELIKNMTIDEMAEMLSSDNIIMASCNFTYCSCLSENDTCFADKWSECIKATKNWLQSEVENE